MEYFGKRNDIFKIKSNSKLKSSELNESIFLEIGSFRYTDFKFKKIKWFLKNLKILFYL